MKKSSPLISTAVSRVILFFASAAAVLAGAGCKPVPPGSPSLQIQLVASGFTHPTALAAPGDGSGRLFITEQTGSVKIVGSSGRLLPAPFLDISDRMVKPLSAYDESGLLGIAFHPDYAVNGRLFIFYNASPTAETPDGYSSNVRVSEFLVSPDDPDSADPASEKVLLEVPHPQTNHNGGQLAFGPDGYLYIGIGDGGASNDVGLGHTPGLGNGQDTANLLGTILRIDVSASGAAAIPPDNPFAGDPQKKEEIYAYGFRNPWRFSFDAVSGRLFCGDVGQNLYEEIDIIVPGGNYGWNIKEGLSCFNKDSASSPLDTCSDTGAGGEQLIDPVISYGRPGSGGTLAGRSVVGGYVYRGAAVPQLQGQYVFGDWSTSFTSADGSVFIAGEDASGSWQVRELFIRRDSRPARRLNRFLLSFGEDENGEIYLLTSKTLGPSGRRGEVYKIIGADRGQQ
jgi:glucose/arabinose dehydrogenase